jgi:hypothetical protein
MRGGIWYFAEPMSVYRLRTPGSWQSRTNEDFKYYLSHRRRIKTVHRLMDKETGYRFHEFFIRQRVRGIVQTARLGTRIVFKKIKAKKKAL